MSLRQSPVRVIESSPGLTVFDLGRQLHGNRRTEPSLHVRSDRSLSVYEPPVVCAVLQRVWQAVPSVETVIVRQHTITVPYDPAVVTPAQLDRLLTTVEASVEHFDKSERTSIG